MHYLGYYLKWHPQSCDYYAVEHGGFQGSPERTPGTDSKYNSIDDRIDDFHYYTTVTEVRHWPRDLRRGAGDSLARITREEGVALTRRFDGEFPERFAEEVFRYSAFRRRSFHGRFVCSTRQLDRAYFDNLTDSFRSPHLWRHVDGKWQLRHVVWDSE